MWLAEVTHRPRGICPACGKDVPMRIGGQAQAHTRLKGERVCYGSDAEVVRAALRDRPHVDGHGGACMECGQVACCRHCA